MEASLATETFDANSMKKLKKKQSICKISRIAKFVFVIFISVFLQLEFYSHHFEKYKNALFILPVMATFRSYTEIQKRNTFP